MSVLYETLTALCRERGITGYKMCKDVGIQPSIMTDLKMGRRSSVKVETAQKIAEYFGVSTEHLLGKEDQKEKAPAKAEADEDPLSQVSFALFGEHDVLDEELLDDVRAYARFKLEQQRKAEEGKK